MPLTIDPTNLVSPIETDEYDLREMNVFCSLLLQNPQFVFPPIPPPEQVLATMAPNQRSVKITQIREQGNVFFKKGDYSNAVKVYTQALGVAASRPIFEPSSFSREEVATLLSNRSAAFAGMGEYKAALDDAERLLALKRNFVKAYFRKARALVGLDRKYEALETLLTGMEFDPTSEELSTEIRSLQRELAV